MNSKLNIRMDKIRGLFSKIRAPFLIFKKRKGRSYPAPPPPFPSLVARLLCNFGSIMQYIFATLCLYKTVTIITGYPCVKLRSSFHSKWCFFTVFIAFESQFRFKFFYTGIADRVTHSFEFSSST